MFNVGYAYKIYISCLWCFIMYMLLFLLVFQQLLILYNLPCIKCWIFQESPLCFFSLFFSLFFVKLFEIFNQPSYRNWNSDLLTKIPSIVPCFHKMKLTIIWKEETIQTHRFLRFWVLKVLNTYWTLSYWKYFWSEIQWIIKCI